MSSGSDNIKLGYGDITITDVTTGTIIGTGTTTGGNGGGGIISTPSIYYPPGTGGISMGTGGSILGGPSLTTEEQAELKVLDEEYQKAIKQKQVEGFKRICPAIRQQIVNEILSNREIREINAATEEKTERHRELEAKKNIYVGQWYGTAGGYSFPPINPPTPTMLTEDEVIQAHTEATMEEECLKQD